MRFVLGIHLFGLLLSKVSVRSIGSVFSKNGVPFKIDRFVTDCQATLRFSVPWTIILTCNHICHLSTKELTLIIERNMKIVRTIIIIYKNSINFRITIVYKRLQTTHRDDRVTTEGAAILFVYHAALRLLSSILVRSRNLFGSRRSRPLVLIASWRFSATKHVPRRIQEHTYILTHICNYVLQCFCSKSYYSNRYK